MGKYRVLFILAAAVVIGGAAELWFLAPADDVLPSKLEAFAVDDRPQSDRFLFDYSGSLRHYEEGTHRYLERLGSQFHIEAIVVCIPTLPAGHSIQTLAVDLVNRWRIGARHEGRGLLLLLVDETKQVKLEVGYALEDVFTDAFSGFVEDLQLGPYYRAGDLGTGLIALMEMFEERAQIKAQGDYTTEFISQADAALLTGGAGAKRDLKRYATHEPAVSTPPSGHGAASPEQAWQIMLSKWAGEGSDADADIYTRMTQLAMGDASKPDPRTLQWLDHWRNAQYQVLREGEHAVIWFGAIDGWENSPFLFCDTGEGWKFDIVRQRQLVVMAENPKWQVAQGPYPYVALMQAAWQSTGKDLPLSDDDLYRCADDTAIATRMAQLQSAIGRNPEDTAAVLELMRLNVITSQRPNRVRPLIDRAKQLAPKSSDPWKYSAIYNVSAFLQYQTALKDIEGYISLRPKDPFGHQLKGFLLYRLRKYQDSIEVLQRAAELNPDDSYAYVLMARDYVMLARKAKGLGKTRLKKKALQMRQRAEAVTVPDRQRLAWLDTWLQRRL